MFITAFWCPFSWLSFPFPWRHWLMLRASQGPREGLGHVFQDSFYFLSLNQKDPKGFCCWGWLAQPTVAFQKALVFTGLQEFSPTQPSCFVLKGYARPQWQHIHRSRISQNVAKLESDHLKHPKTGIKLNMFLVSKGLH